jgi:hypothetical protein
MDVSGFFELQAICNLNRAAMSESAQTVHKMQWISGYKLRLDRTMHWPPKQVPWTSLGKGTAGTFKVFELIVRFHQM